MNCKTSLTLIASLCASTAFAQDFSHIVVKNYEGAAELPKIALTTTAPTSSTANLALPYHAFNDYVSRASNGQIQVETFWSSSLIPYAEFASGVESGIVDFAYALPIYTPTDFPVGNYLAQLSVYNNGGYPGAALVVNAALSEFLISNHALRDELAGAGIVPLGGFGLSGYDMFCNKPFSNLSEANGMRVRSAGEVFSLQAQSLGMVPVTMASSEVYEAISRGMLECIIQNSSALVGEGLTGISGKKYWVNLPLTSFNGGTLMFNQEAWNELPSAAQAILSDAQAVYAMTYAEAMGTGFKDLAALIQSGEITAIDAGQDIIDALSTADAARIGQLIAMAPPSLEDPQAFLDQYLSILRKWQGIVSDELGFSQDRVGAAEFASENDWTRNYDYSAYSTRLVAELEAARQAHP